jgi:hypothetical protein
VRGLAGESDEAQLQSIGDRLFRLEVDGHPNRSGVKREKAMVLNRGLKANDAIGYALTGEDYLAVEVCGKILTNKKPAPDLQKESAPQASTQFFARHNQKRSVVRGCASSSFTGIYRE